MPIGELIWPIRPIGPTISAGGSRGELAVVSALIGWSAAFLAVRPITIYHVVSYSIYERLTTVLYDTTVGIFFLRFYSTVLYRIHTVVSLRARHVRSTGRASRHWKVCRA